MISKVFHIYGDESRQTKERFMVLGGIILDQRYLERFNQTMANFRQEFGMNSELKWQKVSRQKLDAYKAFIDYFFALNNNDLAHFHAMLIDNHKLDHRKFSSGNKEVGFYKMYYQLLLHSFGRRYHSKQGKERFIVILDYRNTSYRLSDLKVILNRGIRKRYGADYDPFVSVEARDSKKSEVLQINDLLVGAVGYQANELHKVAGANPAKIALAEMIAEEAGLENLSANTPYHQKRFTLWNFRLKK